MIENNVWTIPESIPKNAKIINSILVYRKKEDLDIEDKELLYKSRLVILGNLQNESQLDPTKKKLTCFKFNIHKGSCGESGN